jgi:hypothetical protein
MIKGESDVAKFADGTVRDTLYFTLPTGKSSASTIRKGGWKLHLNHAPEDNGRPPMELFKLYNEDGSVADLGEKTNLIDTELAKRDELLADLNAWFKRFDAQLPYKNPAPIAPGKPLPGADKVPKVTKMSEDGDKVSVEIETGADKSRIVEANLIYTTNGSDLIREKADCEEWFRVPATLGEGVVTAVVPPGTTHAIFYLRDENGFLVSTKKMPHSHGKGGQSRWTVANDWADTYAWRPGLLSMISTAESALENARNKSLDTSVLSKALDSAREVAKLPAEEKSYAPAMRDLRNAIRSLDVPQAKLPVMNLFATSKWAGGGPENESTPPKKKQNSPI